jgi:hypothetical protein
MTIQITDELIIGDIQKEFTKTFPFLKLVFFRPTWNPLLIRLQPQLPATEPLRSFPKVIEPKAFHITSKDKVADVEQIFRDLYAIEVQVMRRSGNSWLLTKETDNYTLEQQNSLGLEMARSIPGDEVEDIHEQQ